MTAIGGSTIIAAASTGRAGHSPFEPLEPVFIAWVEYPVLAVGILGVLAFTAEYSTGQIRTTFAAVPQRRAVLAAKAGAVGLLTLCFSELLAFISFFLSQAIVSNHGGLSLARCFPGCPERRHDDGLPAAELGRLRHHKQVERDIRRLQHRDRWCHAGEHQPNGCSNLHSGQPRDARGLAS